MSQWHAFWWQPHVVTLTSTLLFLDGLFHLFGSQQHFTRFAPDHAIARTVLGRGRRGLSVPAHRAMGLVLVAGALSVRYFKKNTTTTNAFQTVVTPFALAVIGSGILLNLFT